MNFPSLIMTDQPSTADMRIHRKNGPNFLVKDLMKPLSLPLGVKKVKIEEYSEKSGDPRPARGTLRDPLLTYKGPLKI